MSEKAAPSANPFVLLKRTAIAWSDANALRLSAALSYYSVFSIAPLLVLAVGIAGWFFKADTVRKHLMDDLPGLVGGRAAQVIQSMVESTGQHSKSVLATCVGIATLLIGASGVFGQLKDALNSIWNVKIKSGGWKVYLRQELLSFGMVLVIGFLLLVSFLLTTLLNAFNKWIEAILQLPTWIWGGVGMAISLMVGTVLFALMFKVLPDLKIKWRDVWVGAFFTAVLFEIGKFGLAWYLGRDSTTSGFGAASAVVLLLLWVYYASCILLFGAQFTKEYALSRGANLVPTKFAMVAEPEPAVFAEEWHPTGPNPARESLTAIFPAPVEAPLPGPDDSRELPEYIREHMAASILSGVGCGFVVGVAERILERKVSGSPDRNSPEENIRTASHMFGAAALVLMARYGSKIADRLKGVLKHA